MDVNRAVIWKISDETSSGEWCYLLLGPFYCTNIGNMGIMLNATAWNDDRSTVVDGSGRNFGNSSVL